MMMISRRALSRSVMAALCVAGSAIAAAAVQQAQPAPSPNSASALRLPQELVVYGTPLKPVVKASVLVNGEVITQTDVEQRMAMLLADSGQKVDEQGLERLRNQTLASLIDEALQIQAARHEEVAVSEKDVDSSFARFASSNKKTPEEMTQILAQAGSSARSLRRQIEATIAWRRLQAAKIESGVTVGEEEVKSVLAKLEAAKGSEEYQVAEIFLASNGATRDEVFSKGTQIIDALRKGAPFTSIARQYSEASTAAVGGDLGWVRAEQLPDPLANAVRAMQPGTVSSPIEVPGGFSIIALRDSRKVLVSDPRDAVLNLKQVTIGFAPGLSQAASEERLNKFVAATRSIGGCGGAEGLANQFNGEVVQSDQVKLKELPEALQGMISTMQIGQATQPFGSPQDGVRVLVLCGRDVPEASLPTYDQVLNRLNDERVNLRSRRYLRDLRRDAIIEFR